MCCLGIPYWVSAGVTGVILGLNLKATAPIWQCVVASIFAIVVVKCLFGGLGCNFANPAVTGRVFALIAFTETLSGGASPKISSTPELVSGATPLTVMAEGGALPSLRDMFLGLRGGAIGEVCAVAIILGFIYLVARRVINFETPIIFVATVFLLSLIADNSFTMATYQILSGGLLFGNSAEVALTQAKLTYTQAIFDYLSAKADLDKLQGKE